jgi:hypothetical protein
VILTEAEAATRWCPFARVSLPANSAGNRISSFHKSIASTAGDRDHYAQQEADCCCIGSRCAAWRWHEWRMKRGPDDQFLNPPVQEQTGFCGLAYSVRLP